MGTPVPGVSESRWRLIVTDAVQISIISSIAAVAVGAVPGVIAAISAGGARRAAERAEKLSHETKEITVQTGKAVDGRLDEMLKLARTLAFREGGDAERIRGQDLAAAVKVVVEGTRPATLPPAVERQEREAGS